MMAAVLQEQSTPVSTVTLRPLRRDAAGRRIDPDCGQLLKEAARLRLPLAPGPGPCLLVTARQYAAAAIALVIATPMPSGLFRGVEVWTTDCPPAPCAYVVLENGALFGGNQCPPDRQVHQSGR